MISCSKGIIIIFARSHTSANNFLTKFLSRLVETLGNSREKEELGNFEEHWNEAKERKRRRRRESNREAGLALNGPFALLAFTLEPRLNPFWIKAGPILLWSSRAPHRWRSIVYLSGFIAACNVIAQRDCFSLHALFARERFELIRIKSCCSVRSLFKDTSLNLLRIIVSSFHFLKFSIIRARINGAIMIEGRGNLL